MNKLLQHQEYMIDIETCAKDTLIPWEELTGKTILISGATGMIASTMIDILRYRNQKYENDISIIAISRNEERARKRFDNYFEDNTHFTYVSHDVSKPLQDLSVDVDYIIHAASNTHPRAYATDPVGTITTNVDGTKNLLELARVCDCKRFVFLSSVEIYGENRGDVDKFDESYMGYIDCNTMRAGYPEAKRLSETLCNAYEVTYGIDFVIPRLSRVYGPTLLSTDSKALSQFIHKAVQKEDIVLKSEGNQLYSYSYVTDAVMGILAIMLLGKNKCAYNIADKNSDITLKELANILADIAGRKVVFEIPDTVENAGYSKATKALLDTSALESIGWKAKVPIREGLQKTVSLLRNSSGC